MFENYVSAKTSKYKKLVALTVALSVLVHVGAASALMIRSYWVIEKLTPPETEITFGMAPPPPPPPPAGSSKPKTEKKKVTKKVVKDTVQPDKDNKVADVEPDDSDSEEEGVEGGVEGGVAGGVVGGVLGGVEGGVLGGTLNAPPPPPPMAPKIVPQVALEQQRISGEKDIQPPNNVNVLIRRAGKKVVATVKMCLNRSGNVKSLKLLRSTGHPAYDKKIKSKMRKWKYRPFKVNGKPVPVCTSVTFIYNPAR